MTTSSDGRGEPSFPRIGWVTNVSAPYRHPVWSAMAGRTNLTVGLLAENESNRRWSAALPNGVSRLPLRSLCLRWRSLHLYVLRQSALRSAPIDALVLPGWENPAAWQLLLDARRRKIATVGFYESTDASHAFGGGVVARARSRFFRAVDVVVTVGRASERAVLGFGVDADRIVRADNAVDVQGIHQAAKLAAPPLAPRTSHFVYVGQLIERKNVDAILTAFAQQDPETRLSIAGEGPEAAKLARRSVQLGISERVQFLGYVAPEAVASLLSTAQTLVLASTVEVYGLVVKEALAAGLHVVVSRPCGVAEDVADMDGVYICETSPESIAAAMRRSSAEWSGMIGSPDVLRHTPDAMAAEVIRACSMAMSLAENRRGSRWRRQVTNE